MVASESPKLRVKVRTLMNVRTSIYGVKDSTRDYESLSLSSSLSRCTICSTGQNGKGITFKSCEFLVRIQGGVQCSVNSDND